MTELDRRLNAFRPDLADERLRGKVEAKAFVAPARMTVAAHFADILARPEESAGLQTQILHGHDVDVFERKNGWAWIQRFGDGYVGYVREDLLREPVGEPTHMVLAPRTFLYPEADLKTPRCGYRSMGSRLSVVDSATTRGTDYFLMDSGEAIIAGHLIELGSWQQDYVTVAESLWHTPYLWGGDTGFGIDCSGLVFLANMLCGQTVLRDSDMQAASIGDELDTDDSFSNLQRGDLVFWKGHVGIMTDPVNLLHASGHSMSVAIEPLEQAVERIGYLYDRPTLVRRP